MKASSIFKEIAVLCYFFIFLKGSMVSLPMFVFLLITIADFGTTEQIFSALAIVGLIIHFLHPSFKNLYLKLAVDVFVFACLLSPIIYRMTILPLSRFNYTLFIVPAAGFAIIHLVSIGFRIKDAVLHHAPLSEEHVNSEEKEIRV